MKIQEIIVAVTHKLNLTDCGDFLSVLLHLFTFNFRNPDVKHRSASRAELCVPCLDSSKGKYSL